MSKSFKRATHKPGDFSDHKIKVQKQRVAAKKDRSAEEYLDSGLTEYMNLEMLNKICRSA